MTLRWGPHFLRAGRRPRAITVFVTVEGARRSAGCVQWNCDAAETKTGSLGADSNS